ncbi:5-dehydro-4-deoxyglucarate dehydratase [Novipirellula galeiformis]|uniref:5-dehydro-4-deoxyglucarate dehydratase n=1 Tax=Novipirellula galeiformis TaxID=2528004 RepID=A0A5C6CJG8_9BACT|nr:dihydrodipicolinate synthase family protein [Novipirellula galeiformis]TWU24245.1 5-dehydro-4-deoxyglucarate dehydratase [Novipirellula galeiformis]
MQTAPFSPAQLRESVIAVPPLARDDSLKIDRAENAKLIKHLEAGGIRSLLYGGNAVFYHVRLAEYESLLQMLADETADDTVVVPSLGPAYGFAMDQVEVLRQFDFPTAMLLPARDIVDQAGIASAVRRIAESYGKPLVLYLKFDRWLDVDLIRKLESDGVISWVKYAVVRQDPAQDDYLNELLDTFPAERIISGIGEQPAIVHVRDFGVAGFTSGCVCVAPAKSMEMMRAIQSGDFETAESIRKWFEPLEDLRNEINPIRVLHHAVTGAGICNTGPLLPMLSELSADQIAKIARVAKQMV